jgi:RsiW-degrading membrane proteinase PrsW (M82 family)/ribosomal protein L32
VLKPLPALVLRLQGSFPEQVDGLVFGVAAGLGFSVAETIVRFSAVLTTIQAHTDPGNWIYPLVTFSILLPLMHGSATGAIACALWRLGRGTFGLFEGAVIVLAVAAHVGFVMVSQLLTDRQFSQLIILAWQAVVVGALLMVIRYMLHEALLEESVDMDFSQTTCPNCHHHIFAARFCPRCGKALAVAPVRPDASAQARPTNERAAGLEVQ